MRIAQVAPLQEAVPPKLYGGTERVVHYLTEELVRMGHDVTLYASADSQTSARLVSPCRRALRLDPLTMDWQAYHVLMLEMLLQDLNEYDFVHFHVDYIHFPMMRRSPVPHVTTLHGRLNIPDLVPLFREFSDMPLVSISTAQRTPLAWANWQGTVHHGLPVDLLKPGSGRGGYFAFLGRISKEKRPDHAMEIARRTGTPLKVAAKQVDPVEPYLKDPLVEYVGEIGEAEKSQFLGEARALLFPLDWEEPFGLVMIEAMACGTPVIAYRRGSVPEVMEDGVTGFIVDGLEEAVRAVDRLEEIKRADCRRVFEERFTASRMMQDYMAVYARLILTRSLYASMEKREA